MQEETEYKASGTVKKGAVLYCLTIQQSLALGKTEAAISS